MKTSRRGAIQLTVGVAAAALCRSALARQPQSPVVDKDRIHLPMRPLRPDEVAFFNSDHSPLGAHASLVYGMQASGGLNMLDVRRMRGRPLMVQDGIVVAVRDGKAGKARVMPFCPEIADPSRAEFSDSSRVQRILRACVDHWAIGYGVSWRHYTPYWKLDDIDHATVADTARFLLPATWMTFTVDNREGREVKTFLFSLLEKSAT